jgi:site-specific DNA-adenine methylase
MFPYAGQKRSFIHRYPVPHHNLLIEPFCGSACYALEHWDRDVWINDRNVRIIAIWQWLKQAKAQDLLSLPQPKHGDDLRNCRYLAQPERDFISLLCQQASAVPNNHVYYSEDLGPECFRRRINYAVERLYRIQHWRITCLDYEMMQMPSQEATWFVDPPYLELSGKYPEHDIEYSYLALWCLQLKGQVIVCEGSKARWLDFQPLHPHRTSHQRGPTNESVWTNDF